MTPSGWQLNDFALLGFACMFGGAIVAIVLGALLARWKGPLVGIAAGMTLWGLGNLTVAALVLAFVNLDSTVMRLEVSRCEPSTDSNGKPQHELFFALPTSAASAAGAGRTGLREVHVKPISGVCLEEGGAVADIIRVRNDDLASGRTPLRGDWVDPDAPLAMSVIWGVFGGAGLLAGLLLASSARKPSPLRPAPVAAAWRKTIGELLGNLGLLMFLGAFIGAFVIDGSTERAIGFGLRGAAMALGCWVLAGLIAGTLTAIGATFMAVVGAIMLGIAELVKRGS